MISPDPKKRRPIFGILTLAAAIVVVMLEIGSYRGGGEVSIFWLLVAAFAGALGLYDIVATARVPKPPGQR